MKRGFLLVALLVLLPIGARAEWNSAWNPPVIDLRVGLAAAKNRDPSLAHGAGQGGYVELKRGEVIGVLVPLPAFGSSAPRPALSEYFELRTALNLSQQFAIDGCNRRTGRISVWLELEAPNELARDPSAVQLWVERGVRVFRIGGEPGNQLTSNAEGTSPGLTPVGREVVQRVYESGALIDVSDASPPTIDGVLAIAEHRPVIATHSNARAVSDRPRNLSDAAIRGIAQSGGLVAATALRDSLPAGRAAKLDHLVHQVLYLARLVGAEHVALGSGFESGAGPVRDFLSAGDYPRLAVALRSAGLSAVDVENIFYRNAQRVLCAPRRPK